MRFPLPLTALACGLLLPLASEAAACTYMIPADSRSASERRAEESRRSRDSMQERRKRAHSALSAGADTGAALAEMLVPNVRPVFSLRGGCGPFEGQDQGEGLETADDWLAGTRYSGRTEEFVEVLEGLGGALPGASCNAEFRGRFAAHLRRRLTARQLGEAYLFLGARWQALDEGSTPGPLTAFVGSTRRPPLRWAVWDQAGHAQILRWTGRTSTGRALKRATEQFWSESGPLLGDMARTCPDAAARWAATRTRLVAAIDAEEARRAALRVTGSR